MRRIMLETKQQACATIKNMRMTPVGSTNSRNAAARHKNTLIIALLPFAFASSAFWFFGKKTENGESDKKPTFQHVAPESQKRSISSDRKEEVLEQRSRVSTAIGPFIKDGKLDTDAEILWNGRKQRVAVNYTLNAALQREADNLLKAYKPDFGAIVAMDPATGKILAMSSFERDPEIRENLTTIATFPAASIFKIVTATAALDKYKLSPNLIIPFNGGNYTLYKKNVFSEQVTRWTKEISLKEAFARSINTVFGKLSIQYMAPQDLMEYGHKYLFNQDIAADFPVQKSWIQVPDDKSFALAEVASGYNKINTLSPVQGAMMASSIVEDGLMRAPYIVESLQDEDGEFLYKAEPIVLSETMSQETGPKVRELMEATIFNGTSRKNFKKLLKNKNYRVLEMGGKTGSLTGNNPRGKTDWFVGYAYFDDQKMAIAAITVNKKQWRVKSAYLAQSLVKTYFKPYIHQMQQEEWKSED
jgi:penicillin-binding protein A